MERPALQPILAPFDGFHESEHAVTGTCLISFDRNRYSVMSTTARRTVQVRAYADRIVIRCGEAIVGEHERHFGRNRTIYDPWHRSEEHTSELQSLMRISYAVFCLKHKTNNNKPIRNSTTHTTT